MVYHWSFCDSKYPQVFGTLLSILADLKNSFDGLHSPSYLQLLQYSSAQKKKKMVSVPKHQLLLLLLLLLLLFTLRFFSHQR